MFPVISTKSLLLDLRKRPNKNENYRTVLLMNTNVKILKKKPCKPNLRVYIKKSAITIKSASSQ